VKVAQTTLYEEDGATVKLCISEGCNNQVQSEGVCCMKHGAKVKRCSSEGCTKFAHKGGVLPAKTERY
jgi:hypothetical protein